MWCQKWIPEKKCAVNVKVLTRQVLLLISISKGNIGYHTITINWRDFKYKIFIIGVIEEPIRKRYEIKRDKYI